MERGALRYLLLDALHAAPLHGYEMIKRLEERSHGLYVPSPGTVYPTLQLLEDQGMVQADDDDGRRVYRLTDAGHKDLEAHAEVVAQTWVRFGGESPSAVSRHEIAFLRDELHNLAQTAREGLHGALRHGDVETVRQVRLALERCKNEIRGLIARAEETIASMSMASQPAAAGPATGDVTRDNARQVPDASEPDR
jgi:DNA-binding PadR family transcriptional regulator